VGSFGQQEAVGILVGVQAHPEAIERSLSPKDEHHETGELVARIAETVCHGTEID
jgi:hypothetical protein